MNPLANINAIQGTGQVGAGDLQSLLKPAKGAAETQAFQQTLANVLGNLMSQTSSSESEGEDAPVVPTGSSLQPLQLSLILAQVNKGAGR